MSKSNFLFLALFLISLGNDLLAQTPFSIGGKTGLNFANSAISNFRSTDVISSAYNQSEMQDTEKRKDPKQAMLLSALWPGIGQFYVGEPVKGTLMAVGQIGFLIPFLDALSAAETEKYGDTQSFRAQLILAFMVGNIIYSVIDAGKTAKALNEGLSFQLEKSDFSPNSLGKNMSNGLCAKILLKVPL